MAVQIDAFCRKGSSLSSLLSLIAHMTPAPAPQVWSSKARNVGRRRWVARSRYGGPALQPVNIGRGDENHARSSRRAPPFLGGSGE
jgi:hypothetical protein